MFLLKGVLALAAFLYLIAPAQSIECYTCEYDSRESSSDSNQKNCNFGDFDESGIDTDSGFEFCYVNHAYVSGNDGTFHLTERDGGSGSESPFARDIDGFEYTYETCTENLCNGAPSLITSLYLMGLVTAFWNFVGRKI